MTVGLLAALVVVALVASLAIGTKNVAPTEVLAMLGGDREGDAGLIWDLRVPRTLMGLLVGVSIGVAGAVAQNITRNPLADPGLIGISAGAAFAVAASVGLLGLEGTYAYVWFAFLGAAVAGAFAYVIGGTGGGGATPAKLALAGAAISVLLDAATSALVLTDPHALDRYRSWAVGSLTGRGNDLVWQLAPFVVAGLVLALVISGRLNALALGDDLATTLGAKAGTTRLLGAAVVVVLTGAAVAAAGPIVFVGLVVPHVLRAFVGPDARWLVPCSGLAGAVLLLAADIIGRVIARPTEVEVGVVTAFLGAPFLIYLVKSGKLREQDS
ncbi:iron ABC transporter permease [Yinghuangia sp. ASG 101]|uniref:FecCD family ABC transporter permease n=1 Tax=Yinghuangia sp. ASG 101 TaxID=2896848 RepID=UPI001E5A5CF6|nr:iron ABC transporter permease [Yinghuangia sp. ASG 101]UGQ10818.1 iron ABC transporter permease [Yinghuangia sp. ASG 101]